MLCAKMGLLARTMSAIAVPVASQAVRSGATAAAFPAVRALAATGRGLCTASSRAAGVARAPMPQAQLMGPCLVATRRSVSSITARSYSSNSSSSENDSDNDSIFSGVVDEDGFSSPASRARDSLPTSGCTLQHDLLSWQEQRHRLRDESSQHIVSMQPVPSTFSAIIAEEDASLCRLDHRLLEQTHAIGSLHAAVHMSSTLKKRRRKMKKHKHRKWLRKMKSVWASLKK